jgi:hypothetical protein
LSFTNPKAPHHEMHLDGCARASTGQNLDYLS